jgi:hypothetical protein
MALALVTAALLSIDLPAASSAPTLDAPNPHRARVTVTAAGIAVKRTRSQTEQQVVALEKWAVPTRQLQGRLIVPIDAALASLPETGELPDRFFSSAVDGWVELFVDRAAPMELVLGVLYTAGQHANQLAVAVGTPDGERVLLLDTSPFGEPAADLLTFGLEKGGMAIAWPGDKTPKKSPRTAEAVRAATAAFAKKGAKGRPVLRPGPLGSVCSDGKAVIDRSKCWKARVVIAVGDPAVTWADVAALAVAAVDAVPSVTFGVF